MSSLLSNILRQARKTFNSNKRVENFETELLVLKKLLDDLTICDLGLSDLVTRNAFCQKDSAPVKFVNIFENEHYAMSVFILDAEYTMPLHDHPMMFGMLKGIAGQLSIRSYSAETVELPQERIIPVIQEPIKEVSSSTESIILTPTTGNFHEITAVEGPAAFFDVLSPPYNAIIPHYGQRKCSFYRKIPLFKKDQVLLERIPTPLHYYCDSEFLPDSVIKTIEADIS